ncbi:MAG: hypothetical protein KME19_14085 [Microcoleus vaginatus WJT46-NPBG5]|jgi:predicted nucleic acid-binding protein|nr:hypothetical protein [Microcoleus vaginatus WJT46-NPBG5]
MVKYFVSTAIQNETSLQVTEQRKIIQKAQDKVYRFWLDLVRQESSDRVLLEFKNLFIHLLDASNPEVVQAFYEIIISSDEEEFVNTIKRSCYILINNWAAERNHQAIQQLVMEVFSDSAIQEHTSSMTLNRLREWIENFIKSKDYEELKLFASRYEEAEEKHWSDRYTSYLLVHQYINIKNSPEQREAARIRAQQLKERFKFDLAMYTARSNSPLSKNENPKNPTGLGDEVLKLIKLIVVKRGQFSYGNLANIFLEQTKELRYEDFKQSLQKYLIYSVDNKDCVEALNIKLSKKLQPIYQEHNEELINDAILLRSCKRVVEFLTTENHKTPSSLFVLLLSQGHPITLVIILLKVVLICKPVRTYLEGCLADLIQYYLNYPEEECQWVVNFLEILKITFVIYDDNVQYNLLKMKNSLKEESSTINLDAYRVFSQLMAKKESNLEADLNTAVPLAGNSAGYVNPFDTSGSNADMDFNPFAVEVEEIFAQ